MRVHHPHRHRQMDKPVEHRLGGVMPLEIGQVAVNPRSSYSITRKMGWVEFASAIEPLQPTAVAVDDPAVRIFGVSRARTTFLEQVAGNKGGLPQTSVRLRPLLEGLAAPVRILMKVSGHRVLSFSRNFEITPSKCRTAAAVSRPV